MDWGEIFGPGALVVLLSTAVAFTMPTALAAVGETVSERAGVLNLGLEGMLLSGALASFLVAYYVGSVALGTLAGVAMGVGLGALMAFLSVTLRTEQIINGIAIVLLAQGLTAFTFEKLFGGEEQPTIDGIRDVEIPLLHDIPGVGPVLFEQNVLFYISFVLAIGVCLLLSRTRFGLSVRAVGESPAAADAAAVPVARTRWLALLICGGMAGMGGAVLVLGQLNLFETNVSAGRGWIAVALVIFGRWNPLLVLGGAFLFGFTDALQIRVQAVSGGIASSVPTEIFAAAPYAVTLIVMVAATVWAGRDAQPAALGVPFRKGVSA
ncbi:MAG: ABC transporter permease [Thermoleophilaceae bacterium]